MEYILYLPYVFLFLLGSALASFIGVVVERSGTGRAVLSGRSKCNQCAKKLSPLELVPVFSWLFLRGRCRSCKGSIPASYTFFELLLGILFVLAYEYIGTGLPLAVFLFAMTVLLYVVWYDLRHMIVQTVPALILCASTLIYVYLVSASLQDLGFSLLLSGIIGFLFFCLHVFSKGRAMGLGDTPIAFALSLLLGANALSGLVMSFWVGAAVGIGLLLLHKLTKGMKQEIPFVPFLAFGYLTIYFTQWNIFSLTWFL